MLSDTIDLGSGLSYMAAKRIPGSSMSIAEVEAQRSDRLQGLLEKIKQRGHRMTPQRVAILRALVMHAGHPAVEELHRELVPQYPSMSLATVYKTVTLLKQMNEILELEFSSRDNRFDGNNPHPHPHLICTSCGRIMDPAVPNLAEIMDHLHETTDFIVTSHRMDFYGLCPDCQKSNQF